MVRMVENLAGTGDERASSRIYWYQPAIISENPGMRMGPIELCTRDVLMNLS